MASIYAYKIVYSGMTWAEVPVRYQTQAEQILRDRYYYTDEQINELKNPV